MHDDERQWHQLVLIWMRDPALFQDYLVQIRPIVENYGGTADMSFEPISIHADGIKLPDNVNLVHYDSKAAYAAFNADPAFHRIKHLRDESVDLLYFDGRLLRDTPAEADAQRIYHIELVHYRDGSPDAYRRYETDGDTVLAHYGIHVDYILEIEPTPPDPNRFDIAKISHFPTPADQTAFEQDLAHKHVGNDLYPAADNDVIWITARRHLS